MIPNNKDLPHYIQDALGDAARISGNPLIATEDPHLDTDVEMQYSLTDHLSHQICYAPYLERHHDTLLLYGATLVNRMWESPIGDRAIPEPTGYLDDGISRDLDQWRLEHPEELNPQMAYHAIYEAVTQMPTDLRVSRALCDRFPQHTNELRAYALDEINRLAVIDSWFDGLPEQLNTPLQSMRAAYSLEMNSIFDEPLMRVPGSYRELGHTLTDLLDQGTGQVGDVAATDMWAHQLGFEQTYRWRNLEE